MMKKIALAVAALTLSATASAAPFVWGNVYTDLLVNDNAPKKETQIIGIEGGVDTGSTDVYGFFEHNPDLENEFGKMTIHSKVIGDFGVYARGSMFKEGSFSEDRYILGVGYQGWVGEDYAIKPYIGGLRIDIDNCSEEEQLAAGFAGYKVVAPGVVLSSWVDARLDDSKVKAAGSVGLQKDLEFVPNTYVGVFYNMSYGENGQKHFADSVQLRVGYHF